MDCRAAHRARRSGPRLAESGGLEGVRRPGAGKRPPIEGEGPDRRSGGSDIRRREAGRRQRGDAACGCGGHGSSRTGRSARGRLRTGLGQACDGLRRSRGRRARRPRMRRRRRSRDRTGGALMGRPSAWAQNRSTVASRCGVNASSGTSTAAMGARSRLSGRQIWRAAVLVRPCQPSLAKRTEVAAGGATGDRGDKDGGKSDAISVSTLSTGSHRVEFDASLIGSLRKSQPPARGDFFAARVVAGHTGLNPVLLIGRVSSQEFPGKVP